MGLDGMSRRNFLKLGGAASVAAVAGIDAVRAESLPKWAQWEQQVLGSLKNAEPYQVLATFTNDTGEECTLIASEVTVRGETKKELQVQCVSKDGSPYPMRISEAYQYRERMHWNT